MEESVKFTSFKLESFRLEGRRKEKNIQMKIIGITFDFPIYIYLKQVIQLFDYKTVCRTATSVNNT